MQDLRDAYRALASTPVVSIVAVLMLGVGIGANTAVFSVVDSLMLRTLPVHEPERLIFVTHGSGESKPFWATYPAWEHIRERELFEHASAWVFDRFDLAEGGETDRVVGIWASGGFFDVLGVRPIRGRTFSEADDLAGGGKDGPVAVISYGFWQQRFGGMPDIVGRSIMVERVPFAIIGVTPRSFLGPKVGSSYDIAIPLSAASLIRTSTSRPGDPYAFMRLRVMARLEPGQTIEEATTELLRVQPQIREATLPNYTRARDREDYMREPLAAVSGATGASSLRNRYQDPIVVLMVVVGLLLLIACSNVASLLLARFAGRRRELGIRAALGASRLRLFRQLLAESLVLSLLAAAFGLLFGYWSTHLLLRELSTAVYSVSLDLSFNWRILVFTATTGLATAILFGTVPALRATRAGPSESLNGQGPAIIGSRPAGADGVLIVVQVALSLMLVVAAGLFLRTFSAFVNIRLGFEPESVLMIDINTRRSAVDPSEKPALYESVRGAAGSVPGVASAACSPALPIGFRAMTTVIEVPDEPSLSERDRSVHKNLVTPDWFRTLGTRLLTGRDFNSGDRAGAPRVAIVNEAFARRFLKGSEPTDRVVREDRASRAPVTLEIIGLVEDMVYRSVREPAPPTIYLPVAQAEFGPMPFFNVVVRPSTDTPAGIARTVAAAIREVDPDLALTLRPMADQVSATFNQERMLAILAGSFSGAALFLVAMGLYGALAHAVSRRRTEFAVRMALGADPGRVAGIVLGRVAAYVSLGIVLGWMFSLWAVELVQALLFGLPARDPRIFGASAVVLLVVAATSTWLPAHRAGRLDPAEVLREG